MDDLAPYTNYEIVLIVIGVTIIWLIYYMLVGRHIWGWFIRFTLGETRSKNSVAPTTITAHLKAQFTLALQDPEIRAMIYDAMREEQTERQNKSSHL